LVRNENLYFGRSYLGLVLWDAGNPSYLPKVPREFILSNQHNFSHLRAIVKLRTWMLVRNLISRPKSEEVFLGPTLPKVIYVRET